MSENHFAQLLNQAIKPQLEAFAGMLADYEVALLAIIGKLAQIQILTLEDSRAAIAGALALLNEANVDHREAQSREHSQRPSSWRQ
jgi:hypothetical protein